MARSRGKSKTPSRRDLRSDRGAFTLIELLMVIVILSLLLALLFPSLRGVRQRYNMTRCQTNLAHIYQAFRLRAADEAMDEAPAYLVEGWTTALLLYLEDDASQFKCMETFEGDETEGPTITEFVYVHTQADWGPVWDRELIPGPYILKLSQTQFNEARNKDGLFTGYVKEFDPTTDYPQYASYVPDNQPNIYWLCMEDVPGGKGNYSDLMIKVTCDKSDKSVLLECITAGTNCYNTLIDKETGEVLIRMKHGGADWNPRSYTLLGVTGEPTSYGMNEYAIDKFTADGKLIRRGVGGAGGKILVLDYSRPVASPDKPDDWTDEVFNPDQSDVPRFARHFGMANVLFSDGSVRPERPEDIDPMAPTAAMKWWLP